jgi:hypothetical protein
LPFACFVVKFLPLTTRKSTKTGYASVASSACASAMSGISGVGKKGEVSSGVGYSGGCEEIESSSTPSLSMTNSVPSVRDERALAALCISAAYWSSTS